MTVEKETEGKENQTRREGTPCSCEDKGRCCSQRHEEPHGEEVEQTKDSKEKAFDQDQQECKQEPSKEEVDRIMRELAEYRKYKDQYLRSLADLDNQKKRMLKERNDAILFAKKDLFREVLLPLDQMEHALHCSDQCSEEVKTWCIGFRMILQNLKSMLESHGVCAIETAGATFDSQYHEAVELIPDPSVPPGTILGEVLTGYRLGNHVLRHSRVRVAGDPKEEKGDLVSPAEGESEESDRSEKEELK